MGGSVLKIFLKYLLCFVLVVFASTLADSSKVFSSDEDLLIEIVEQYGDLHKFREEFMQEFLNWEIATPEAKVAAQSILKILLSVKAISLEDCAWFEKDLEKRII